MKLTGIIIFSSMIFSHSIYACSFGSSAEIFTPTLERWKEHAGPAQSDPSSGGEFWESVPKPVVKVLKVTRGSISADRSC